MFESVKQRCPSAWPETVGAEALSSLELVPGAQQHLAGGSRGGFHFGEPGSAVGEFAFAPGEGGLGLSDPITSAAGSSSSAGKTRHECYEEFFFASSSPSSQTATKAASHHNTFFPDMNLGAPRRRSAVAIGMQKPNKIRCRTRRQHAQAALQRIFATPSGEDANGFITQACMPVFVVDVEGKIT
jgi:hypothetical protein